MTQSRPLTCPGFRIILDSYGFSADHPDELANLAAELATRHTTHPVFEAMASHLSWCDHCMGINDPEVAKKVACPRFGKIA
ncbi:MAG: hypothetical protein ACRDYZ_12055 [Acidimicrobiales bacterium]